LFYGIGTMFSMAVLSFMVSLALDMVTRVAIAMWTSAAAGQLLLGQNVVGGMNSMAMQQGGMGLILTTLILTAPPMAAMFFNGTLGGFVAYSMMGSQLGGGPPPMGAPMPGGGQYGGGYGGGYTPTQPGTSASSDAGRGASGDFRTAQNAPYQSGPRGAQTSPDAIRPTSQMPGRETGDPNAGRVTGGSPAYEPPQPGTRGAQQVEPGSMAPTYYAPPSTGPAPQGVPPPTRVADSPPAHPQTPTYQPPPPPKDRS
jgi:hypothetical protein